ncbi:MAG: hypothetical protein V3U57_07725 [Robiginitomaculum sp.]
MTVSWKAQLVPHTRGKTKIDPSLLAVRDLTPAPPATDYSSLDQRAIIFGSDLAQSRQDQSILIGAIKQAEYTDELLTKADKQRADKIKTEIKKLNSLEVKQTKPWYKKIF